MKRFFSVLSLVLVILFVPLQADAKKFGGGKSFGKSYKTAPAPSANRTNAGSINKQSTPAPTNQSGKKGFMGGLLGGLLAGGLMAALFAGGAFDGFKFFDFIIIALGAFLLFKLIKMLLQSRRAQARQTRPAYAQSGGVGQNPNQAQRQQATNQAFRQTAPSSGSDFGAMDHDVPFNYPPNFDKQAFISGAREHYRILQQAWNKNQLETIQEYVSIEMYNDLATERASLIEEQHTEVMYVDAKIVRADSNYERAQLSLKFSGRYRDAKEGIEDEIKDIWHLERSLTAPNAPWLIVGIE